MKTHFSISDPNYCNLFKLKHLALKCFTEILPNNSSHSVEISALQIEEYDCFSKITNIMFIEEL